jgi:hypothetical protein
MGAPAQHEGLDELLNPIDRALRELVAVRLSQSKNPINSQSPKVSI